MTPLVVFKLPPPTHALCKTHASRCEVQAIGDITSWDNQVNLGRNGQSRDLTGQGSKMQKPTNSSDAL